jgi:lysophospholipase L1-like esterase
MISNLYTFGDSWTYGCGLADLHERVMYRYPAILKQLVGASKHTDRSYPGRSNKNILRDVKNNAPQMTDEDLAIIGLTSPYRFVIQCDTLEREIDVCFAEDIIQGVIFFDRTLAEREVLKEAAKEIKQKIVDYTDERIYREYHEQLAEMREALRGKRYAMFSCFTPISNHTTEDRVCFYPYSALQCLPDNVNRLAGYNSNDAPLFESAFLASDGHPNIRGHQFIANELYKYMIDKAII